MMNSHYTHTKRSHLEGMVQNFMVFTIVFVLVMAVISTVVLIAQASELNLILQFEEDAKNGLKFFFYIILYSPFMPLAIYGTIDLIVLIQRRNLTRNFEKLATNQPDMALRVINPDALPNLGQITHCLIDKTGTLTSGEFKVQSILMNQSQYRINEAMVRELKNAAHPTKTEPVPEGQPNRDPFASKARLDEKPITYQTEGENLLPEDENLKTYGHRAESLDMSVDVELQVNQEGEHHKLDSNQIMFLSKQDKLASSSPLEGGLIGEQPNTLVQVKDSTSKVDLGKTEEIKTSKIDLEKPQTYTDEGLESGRMPAAGKTGTIVIPQKDTEDFINSFKETNNKSTAHLLKALSLCHMARSTYNSEVKDKVPEAARPEELVLVNFGAMLGHSFYNSNSPENPTLYTVQVKGEKQKVEYQVLGLNKFSHKRKRTSICIRDSDERTDESATLYVKGSAEAMLGRSVFDKNTQYVLDQTVTKNKKDGMRTIVVAQRKLEASKARDFQARYQGFKSSLVSREDDLEQLADEFENDLEVLALIGIKDTPRDDAMNALTTLRSAGIKTWMVTGDSLDQAISAGYEFSFINDARGAYYINQSDYSGIRIAIRDALSNLKEKVRDSNTNAIGLDQGAKDYGKRRTTITGGKTTFEGEDREKLKNTIVVSGKAWQIISADEYLYSNFAFLCAISSTVVAYDMSPIHKRNLVRVINKRFPRKPMTLAIGDGINDILMLQAADFSIELQGCTKESERHLLNAGDIRIKSLKPLKELLVVHGRNFSYRVQESIIYLFSKSYLIGFPLFFYNWYSSFTGATQYESMLVFMYSFVFTFFPIIFFAGMGSDQSYLILMNYPALYTDGKITQYYFGRRFVLESVLKPLLQSAIIYYVTVYVLRSGLNSDGHTTSFAIIMLAQYYAMIVLSNLEVNTFSSALS